MALLLWNDGYNLGIASMDAQHQEMAGLVNTLASAEGDAAIHRALDRLMLFTEKHFDYEHALFRQTGYPAADIHTKRHGFLTLILKRFGQTVASQGSTAAELAFLRGWLLDHIGKDDRAFADYVRSQYPALCG
jgi:hemerythrin